MFVFSAIAFFTSSVNVGIDNPEVNLEFDAIYHNGKEFWINKKYIVVRNTAGTQGSKSRQKSQKRLKEFDRIIENQFRYHYDTVLLKKSPWVIKPDSLVSITEKIHDAELSLPIGPTISSEEIGIIISLINAYK